MMNITNHQILTFFAFCLVQQVSSESLESKFESHVTQNESGDAREAFITQELYSHLCELDVALIDLRKKTIRVDLNDSEKDLKEDEFNLNPVVTHKGSLTLSRTGNSYWDTIEELIEEIEVKESHTRVTISTRDRTIIGLWSYLQDEHELFLKNETVSCGDYIYIN